MRRPASVMRPSASSAPSSASSAVAAASAPAAAGRGTADRRARRPRRRSPAPAPTAPPPGFPAGRTPPGRGAAPWTTAGSPRPAPRARRGRRAAPRRRGRCAAWPAGSARWTGRAAARAASRRRPRCARQARSARSRRSRSPAPPAARSAGRSARSCSAGGRSPCSGSTSAPQSCQRRLGAADLRHAGQEGQDVALVLRQCGAHRAGHRVRQVARAGDVARGVADRDREHAAGAFDRPRRPSAPASRAPSAVADMASSRSSGRSTRCRSRQSASARSDSSDRSCTSSRITAATPSSPGSDCRRRTSRPSVTTSMRVAGGDGGVEPGAVADGAADRLAEQRRPCGSRRRGWRAGAAPASGSLPSPRHGASSSVERHQGGLAGAGRRDQHGVAAGRQRRACRQRRQGFGDGQFGQTHSVVDRGGFVAPYAHEMPPSAEAPMPLVAQSDAASRCSPGLARLPAAAWRAPPVDQPARHRVAGLRHRRGRPRPCRSASACGCGWRPGWHTYWQNPGDAGRPAGAALRRCPPARTAGPIAGRRRSASPKGR